MVLDELDVTHADGYLRRGDFSRWIVDVFGDHALARELQDQEREYLQSPPGEAVARIAAAIKSRYELTEENEAGSCNDSARATRAYDMPSRS